MIIELAVAFLATLALSLGLNRLMVQLAPRLGLMDQPGGRRIHAAPIPRAGGIAIWLSFLIVMAVGLGSGLLEDRGILTWNWFRAFAAGSLVLMVTGILDDRGGLPPLVKLGAHALAPTVFLLLHPVNAQLFPESWPVGLDMIIFVIWSVVLINAFNLIDGLDGLCGGLAAVATLSLAGIALMNERTDAALLLLVMGGAITGFLKFNYNPARIFLGDAGSMLIGFFLATAATDAVGRKAVVGIILLPIAIAGVPLLDVLLAIWRRGARRLMRQLRGDTVTGGIFDADREHLHHRMLDSNKSQRKVALTLQGIAILLAAFAFLPMLFGDRMLSLSIVGLVVVGLVGLRHLARVEIQQTGSVVHMAIKLQGLRRSLAATLFMYDVLVIVTAAMIGVIMETNFMTRDAGIPAGQFVIVFTIMCSLATLVARIHLRLWVRATTRDVVGLQFWMFVAALATFTLFGFANHAVQWSSLRMCVISYVFAVIGICLPRVALDLCREFGLEAYHGNTNGHGDEPTGYGPVVVFGAGDLGTLFLDHLKSSAHTDYLNMQIVGFLDDSKALHGRRLRAFRVLGDMSQIPGLVKAHALRGIVVAIREPSQELLDALATLAKAHNLRIYHWNVGMTSIPEDAANAEIPPASAELVIEELELTAK